ncbi:MAG: hypothetical protein QM528_06055 [Phycisphaerales bacterium]|nr:hypothetical protein [Phycisphaerales bacterium]
MNIKSLGEVMNRDDVRKVKGKESDCKVKCNTEQVCCCNKINGQYVCTCESSCA